jgi:trehalose 6-phosphate synthase/phosphatase
LLEKTKQRNLIFSSVDRNHIISGVKNKLLAFLSCLDSFPRIRNSACLVQYSGPYECPICLKTECGHEDKNYKEIKSIIQTINNKYKGSLIYIEENLSHIDRVALWQVTNFLLVTSLRDGQSIVPIEFIAVKESEKKLQKSAVILSEFCGCNRALGGILRVNPFNVEDISRAIDLAI